MKLITIVGARPQFVKAATVCRAAALGDDIDEVIVHTGQHYDANLSDVFFEELEIPVPRYNLGIGGGSHGMMTGRQLEAIEAVLLEENPDWVLVFGDTNSTLAGAIAAAKLHIPLAHVEAGLRSFNRRMPEEINRILTDHAADRLFAPTKVAMENLRNEGLPEGRLRLVGDVMYDAARHYRTRSREPAWFSETMLVSGEFVLATVHRAENTDDPSRLAGIFTGLADSGREIVLPIHPRTRERLEALQLGLPSRIRLVPPVGYLEMVWLEANCAQIASDSGGVQKEAYFHGRRFVILRDETEWVELVDEGWNILAGTNPRRISEALASPLPSKPAIELYGAGNAAELILRDLLA